MGDRLVKARRLLAACIVMSMTPGLISAQSGEGDHLRLSGFSTQASAPEREWEKKFQDGIAADNLRESMRRLSARPHHVGSPYDKDNAEWMLGKFKEFGFDAHIETFRV